jgi:hypothetical protein
VNNEGDRFDIGYREGLIAGVQLSAFFWILVVILVW